MGDSAGTMANIIAHALLPIIVVNRFGPTTNAYFYIAWTTSVGLNLLAINMGMSLTVEGSFEASNFAAHVKAAARRMSLLLVPMIVLGVVFAPQILAIFGPSYVTASTALFRLMVLAVVPHAVIELYLGTARAQGYSRKIAFLQGSHAALFIGLVFILIGPLGITGIGWAFLLSSAVVSAPLLSRLRALSARTGEGEPNAA